MALTGTDAEPVRSTIWRDFGYVIKMMSGDKKCTIWASRSSLATTPTTLNCMSHPMFICTAKGTVKNGGPNCQLLTL